MSLNKIWYYLLPILRLQLFITLVAMPILVYWGLPISILTIAGNIIFAPILTLFLFISSLIFFCEICHIPNHTLIYLLEKISALWLRLSPPCAQNYLLYFPQNSYLLFLSALILTLYLLLRLNLNLLKQVGLLSLILLSTIWLSKLSFWININSVELTHRKHQIKIDYLPNKQLIIHDYGTLSTRYGIQNWLCYQLMPTLIKNFGTVQVQTLYLHKTNQFTPTNLELLKQNLSLKAICYQK